MLTTDGICLGIVPIVLILDYIVIIVWCHGMKTQQRTVTSTRAHWGTRTSKGTGFGNLWANQNIRRNRLSDATGTHDEGGRTFVQLVTHVDHLVTDI